jgi:hypothetical protein
MYIHQTPEMIQSHHLNFRAVQHPNELCATDRAASVMFEDVLNIGVSLLKSEAFKQLKRKVYYSLFIIRDIKIYRHLVIEIASNRFNASRGSIPMQDLAYTIGSNDLTGFQNRFVKRVFFAFDSCCRFLPSSNTTKTPQGNSGIISAALDS